MDAQQPCPHRCDTNLQAAFKLHAEHNPSMHSLAELRSSPMVRLIQLWVGMHKQACYRDEQP